MLGEVDLPIHKILQHGSTLLGLLIIVIFLYLIRRKGRPGNLVRISPQAKVLFWGMIFVLTILFVVVRISFVNDGSILRLFGTMLVTAITGFTLSSTFMSVIYLGTGIIPGNRQS